MYHCQWYKMLDKIFNFLSGFITCSSMACSKHLLTSDDTFFEAVSVNDLGSSTEFAPCWDEVCPSIETVVGVFDPICLRRLKIKTAFIRFIVA